jgi:hypothetical protein
VLESAPIAEDIPAASALFLNKVWFLEQKQAAEAIYTAAVLETAA